VVDPTEPTEIIKIELLEVIEFDSTRKRMTSIVRMPDGKIKVLMKGADSIIIKRLADPNDPLIEVTNGFLQEFAVEGLRTLLLCERTITEEYYEDWSYRYHKAQTQIEGKE